MSAYSGGCRGSALLLCFSPGSMPLCSLAEFQHSLQRENCPPRADKPLLLVREINWEREYGEGSLSHSPSTEEAVNFIPHKQNTPRVCCGYCSPTRGSCRRLQNIVQIVRSFTTAQPNSWVKEFIYEQSINSQDGEGPSCAQQQISVCLSEQ